MLGELNGWLMEIKYDLFTFFVSVGFLKRWHMALHMACAQLKGFILLKKNHFEILKKKNFFVKVLSRR